MHALHIQHIMRIVVNDIRRYGLLAIKMSYAYSIAYSILRAVARVGFKSATANFKTV